MKSSIFLVVLVLALASRSAEALAQAPTSIYRIGLLSVGPDPTDQSPFGAGLIRGFARHGFVLGQNLAFERRAAHGQLDRLPQLVDELAAQKVAVIVTMGYPAALAAKNHTSLPVVIVQAGDPVEDGLAASFAKPGGHLTGLSEIAAELSLSEKTIGTYRTRVSQKLSLATNVELTRYALQHKLVE